MDSQEALHWVRGWYERLRYRLWDDGSPPSKYDWCHFQPDRMAANALDQLSVEYSHIVTQIAAYVKEARRRETEYLADETNEDLIEGFASAQMHLCDRLRSGIEVMGRKIEETPVECLVTLQQAAAMVSRGKSTLEKYKGRMPTEHVKGKGGKPSLWTWSELRPWLAETFDMPKLPKRFPADKFRQS